MQEDTYNIISDNDYESLFKEKGSKFIAYAYHVENEDEVKERIDELKKSHYAARHHCYAYRLGKEDIRFRANDDGEPSNSAGNPILGQIVAKDLTNTLVVVVRYFGGVKLGVGGLIQAYKTAAKEILDMCEIHTKTVNKEIIISFEYAELNNVMRFIKERKLNILNQEMELMCKITLSVRKKDANFVYEDLLKMHKIKTEFVEEIEK